MSGRRSPARYQAKIDAILAPFEPRTIDELLRMAWWNAIFCPTADLPALERRIAELVALGARIR